MWADLRRFGEPLVVPGQKIGTPGACSFAEARAVPAVSTAWGELQRPDPWVPEVPPLRDIARPCFMLS